MSRVSQRTQWSGCDNEADVKFKEIIRSLDFLFRFASRQNERIPQCPGTRKKVWQSCKKPIKRNDERYSV